MTPSILQRIHALAEKPPTAEALKALATIARKLATDDDAVGKAHVIAGVVMGFAPAGQDAIVRAVEALGS